MRHLALLGVVAIALLQQGAAVPTGFAPKNLHARTQHYHAPTTAAAAADLVLDLPGAPADVSFKQYAGKHRKTDHRPCPADILVPPVHKIPRHALPLVAAACTIKGSHSLQLQLDFSCVSAASFILVFLPHHPALYIHCSWCGVQVMLTLAAERKFSTGLSSRSVTPQKSMR